jgi:hypothetical protein
MPTQTQWTLELYSAEFVAVVYVPTVNRPALK